MVSVLAIYGKFAIFVQYTIVVAILISSRFVCIVFSPKYGFKGFASLLGCTVHDVTLAADVGRNPGRQRENSSYTAAC